MVGKLVDSLENVKVVMSGLLLAVERAELRVASREMMLVLMLVVRLVDSKGHTMVG